MKRLSRLLLLLAVFASGFAAHAEPRAALKPKLEALSARGNGEAAYHLGMIHHLGLNGEPKDARKAFELFRLAAERGDPLGAYKLGCFYHGQGEGIVSDDPALALRYKLVAAEAGYSLAQADVAFLYFERRKTRKGLQWLEAAARQGYGPAFLALIDLYSGQFPAVSLPKDPAKAFAFTKLLFASMEGGALIAPSIEADLRRHMTAEEARRGEAIVAAWHREPTALTVVALSGQQAAERLVAGAR